MRDEKEERKKQARSNKQTRQSGYIVYTPGFLFAFPCIRGRGLGTRLQQLPSPGVKLALRVDVETLVAILAVGEHPDITQHVLIHVVLIHVHVHL